jgi:hypothetical protein
MAEFLNPGLNMFVSADLLNLPNLLRSKRINTEKIHYLETVTPARNNLT